MKNRQKQYEIRWKVSKNSEFCRNFNENTKTFDDFCLDFEIWAVRLHFRSIQHFQLFRWGPRGGFPWFFPLRLQRCEGVKILQISKNAEKWDLGRKNRLQYRGERARQSFSKIGGPEWECRGPYCGYFCRAGLGARCSRTALKSDHRCSFRRKERSWV